ncbi:EAL domain-containing protein [Futiania mangrovi]|uniref:EAL domain-containing protein n=1 Tax=Futiania mangrovi TaxID=2959716 RepID=A0A9J6PLW8_9PROT|nr:EAL domain-containing protein [Futiania mangrovii]MCP1337647.1 EAL domain-containing protein [Futiania mangrovii]
MVPVSHGVFIVLNAIIAGAVAALAHWMGGSGAAAFAVFLAAFALACLVQSVLSARSQVRTLRRRVAAQDELLTAFKKEFKVTRTLLNQLADSLEDVIRQRDLPSAPAEPVARADAGPAAQPRMPRQERPSGMAAAEPAPAVTRETARAEVPVGGMQTPTATSNLDAMLSLDEGAGWSSPAPAAPQAFHDEAEEETRLVAGGGARYGMTAPRSRTAPERTAPAQAAPAVPAFDDDFDDDFGGDLLDDPTEQVPPMETPSLASALRETAEELQAERGQPDRGGPARVDPFAFLDEPEAAAAPAADHRASRDALASILDELEREDDAVILTRTPPPQAPAPEAEAPRATAPQTPAPRAQAPRAPQAPAPQPERALAPQPVQQPPRQAASPAREVPVAAPAPQPPLEGEAAGLRSRIASALNRPARAEESAQSFAAEPVRSAAFESVEDEPRDSTLGLPLDFDAEDDGDFVDVTAHYSGRELDLDMLAATPAAEVPAEAGPQAGTPAPQPQPAAQAPQPFETTADEEPASDTLAPSLSAWMQGIESQNGAEKPALRSATEEWTDTPDSASAWDDSAWDAPDSDSYAGDETVYAGEPQQTPAASAVPTPAPAALPSLGEVLGAPAEESATFDEDDLPVEGVRRTASAFGRRGRPAAPPAASAQAPAQNAPAPQATAQERVPAQPVSAPQPPRKQVEPKTPAAPPQIRLDVIDTLNWAISQNAVDLFLQPVIKVPERKVHYFEGFSRVRAPDGQYLMPDRYLKPAAESGLIGTIDNLMLSRCMQLVRAMKRAGRDIGVFCNISGNTLKDEVFFEEFLTFMRENRDLARSVIFEMTQATVKEAGEEEWERVRELVRLGFPLSMDNVSDWVIDFGLLARRGFRFIKVDAATALRGMADNGAMIRPNELRDKLHQRGISLIVEKIEDEDTFKRVLACHVDYAQGYLFGAPERIDEGELG